MTEIVGYSPEEQLPTDGDRVLVMAWKRDGVYSARYEGSKHNAAPYFRLDDGKLVMPHEVELWAPMPVLEHRSSMDRGTEL